MKFILLHCATLGYAFGDTIPVGTKKGEISPDEAKTLIDEGMAVEYKAPVSGGGNKALDAANARIAELEEEATVSAERIAELKEAATVSAERIAELEGEVASLNEAIQSMPKGK